MFDWRDEDEAFGEGECTCHHDPEYGWLVDRWCPVHGAAYDDDREFDDA